MKKGLILFTALFLLSAFSAFAAVTVKKDGDMVKVTWTYTNPDAASVGLVGDFQGWNLAGALPMKKNANGVWSITLSEKPDWTGKYKFNVDGEWTEDPTAPDGVDDGFGGTNGYVVVSDLLAAAGGAMAGAAPAPHGLVPSFYEVSQATARFYTQNPVDKTKDGFSLKDAGIQNKAYLGWDGYLMPGLLKTTGEIRLFNSTSDKMVMLYQKKSVYDAGTGTFVPRVTTSWNDGLATLAHLPYSLLSTINTEDSDNWPGIKGKIKMTLKLDNLDMTIVQSAGWMKATKISQYLGYLEYFVDPDAGTGLTEIFNTKDLGLSGGKLNYYVDFDRTGSTLINRAAVTYKTDNMNLGILGVYDSKTTVMNDFTKAGNFNGSVYGDYTVSGFTVKGQFAANANTDGSTIEKPYIGILGLAYAPDKMLSVSLDSVYNGNSGWSTYDQNLVTEDLKASYSLSDSLSLNAENVAKLTNDKFKPTADQVTVGGTYKTVVDITPTAVFNLPVVSGDKFNFDHIHLNVSKDAFNVDARWTPNADFTVNKIIALSTYHLDTTTSVGLGLGYLGDKVDTTPNFGFAVNYSMITPFEAIKSPMFFASFDYNLTNEYEATDDDVAWQSVSTTDADGTDFSNINVAVGATLRAGLKFSF